MDEAPRPAKLGMNPTATHQAILFGMVGLTTGPVIEFGVGYNSTMQLHYLCPNRFLMSVEKDQDWHDFFCIPFRDGCHEFQKLPENKPYSHVLENERYKDIVWDVAFVDHSPSEERKLTVEALRKKAKFIVVHDAEPDAVAYEWGNIFDTFKYQYRCNFYPTQVIVVSDFEPIQLPKKRW